MAGRSNQRSTSGGRGIHFLRVLSDRAPSSANCGVFIDVCTVDLLSNELCRAVSLGAVKLVRTLVQGGFDVNSTNSDRQTCLHVLVMTRDCLAPEDATLLKVLLAQPQLNVNAQDRYGKTALMYVVAMRRGVHVLDLLLQHNADIFLQDKLGFTALIYAFNLEEQNANSAMTRRLSDHCQQLGRQMVQIETPLSANFMSFLKIQKLVGAEHGTVHMSSTPSTSPGIGTNALTRIQFPTGSSSTPPSRQRMGRRISEFGSRLGSLVAKTPSCPPGDSMTHSQPLSRRRSSMQPARSSTPKAQHSPIESSNSRSHNTLLPHRRTSSLRRHSCQTATGVEDVLMEDDDCEEAAPALMGGMRQARSTQLPVPELSVTDLTDCK